MSAPSSVIPPPMEMGVDGKRIRKASSVPPPVHSFFHTALYFPLRLPQDRILKSHDRAHRQQLICFAIVFWLIIVLAAAGFLGVWFIGYSGAHLSSTEERASFQVLVQPQFSVLSFSFCVFFPRVFVSACCYLINWLRSSAYIQMADKSILLN